MHFPRDPRRRPRAPWGTRDPLMRPTPEAVGALTTPLLSIPNSTLNRVGRDEGLVVRTVRDRHAEVPGVDGVPMRFRSKPERVRKMGNPHRPREAAPQLGARPHKGGASTRDEVSGVHVGAVRGLGDVQRNAHSFGEPLVSRDVELAQRLLVPEVAGFGESVSNVDGVREIEAGRSVVHERVVAANMLADR